jgi:membrane-associated phospholipid phosphatase
LDSPDCPDQAGFVRQLRLRLTLFWATKTVGLTLGIAAFFAAYFAVLRHPLFAVTVMPLTDVDRFVGFHPAALPLYLSLWVYVPLVFVLLKNRRDLLLVGAEATVLSVMGLGIFLLWPTAAPDPGIDWSSQPSLAFLKSVDASGNACPSLHVAFAVFAAIRLRRLWQEMHAPQAIRAGNWLWCAGIVWSTLATGQHVVLDALAGALLGAVVAWPKPFRQPTSCSAVGTTQR